MLDQFWLWSMEGGLKNAFASIKAFSETDFKARRNVTIRVDLMVSGLPNQDEINADLLEFLSRFKRFAGQGFMEV